VVLLDGIHSIAQDGGVYHLDIPAGVGVEANTSARPIVTGANGSTPSVTMGDSSRIEDVWFGGTMGETELPIVLGDYCQLLHNTFFNYYGCINEGAHTHNTIERNRLINCGYGGFWHGIYVSNMHAVAGEGATIDRNILVGGAGGYAVHLWHNPGYCTVHNNFYGDIWHGLVISGKYNVASSEVIWSTQDPDVDGGCLSLWLPANNNTEAPPDDTNNGLNLLSFTHGFIGRNNWRLYVSALEDYDPATVIDGNYFVNRPDTGVNSDFGTNAVDLAEANVDTYLGQTAAAINAAIDALSASFAASTATVYADSTIENNFALIAGVQAAWDAYGAESPSGTPSTSPSSSPSHSASASPSASASASPSASVSASPSASASASPSNSASASPSSSASASPSASVSASPSASASASPSASASASPSGSASASPSASASNSPSASVSSSPSASASASPSNSPSASPSSSPSHSPSASPSNSPSASPSGAITGTYRRPRFPVLHVISGMR
jgi:hypothetical protein